MAEEIFDDKTPHVLSFILPQIERHFQSSSDTPFFIGLNGVQGAGKTVLVSGLAQTLSSPPHNLPTCVFSLDDLYLTHADQVSLARSNPKNPLLQHRGQPGTHDIPIALDIFEKLKCNSSVRIPKYNKALFSGQGDRQPESEWDEINNSPDPEKRVKIVIFEGWCVGFQSLAASELQAKHANAVSSLQAAKDGDLHVYTGRLAHNTLESVTTINESLMQYEKLWAYFNVFIHIDALNPLFVYRWRLQQEATTKREKGGGMSDDEVKAFVDGYYPSYELYSDTLREGIFKPKDPPGEAVEDADAKDGWRGRQLRLVVAEDRRVREVITL
jgi:D-glycerate 3-kinase